jgi:oligopeptide transport system substrate-binding protein
MKHAFSSMNNNLDSFLAWRFVIGRHAFLILSAALLGSCEDKQQGPLEISAIGGSPQLANPNLVRLDVASELLIQAIGQGLVHFDQGGQIEPALAQSWIVSDDGLRYTFRLRRIEWPGGGKVTAEQVSMRLRAATSDASRNPLKPMLGAIDEIEAMTDEVLEISLKSPRPNFLQLLAQPEMAIMLNGRGTGPYHAVPEEDGAIALHLPSAEGEGIAAEEEDTHTDVIKLRGERAALAVARLLKGRADLVVGGTVGDLPIARAGDPGSALRFDPAAGLFGLSFGRRDGRLADVAMREALAMAIDRPALVAALNVPDLQPRETLIPAGIAELPRPAAPGWTAISLPQRRARAAEIVAATAGETRAPLRVALPAGPGYRLIFAHIRKDWRAIGVETIAVPEGDRSADLHFVDRVAPAELASWYLRQFSCAASAICDALADEAMAAARIAQAASDRQAQLAIADRILAGTTPFIPLAAPVRWSLVSQRITGFRPNIFARHGLDGLIAETP